MKFARFLRKKMKWTSHGFLLTARAPVLIAKGAANQTLMEDAVKIRMDFFRQSDGEMLCMKKIPVIYRDR